MVQQFKAEKCFQFWSLITKTISTIFFWQKTLSKRFHQQECFCYITNGFQSFFAEVFWGRDIKGLRDVLPMSELLRLAENGLEMETTNCLRADCEKGFCTVFFFVPFRDAILQNGFGIETDNFPFFEAFSHKTALEVWGAE